MIKIKLRQNTLPGPKPKFKTCPTFGLTTTWDNFDDAGVIFLLHYLIILQLRAVL